MGFFDRLKTIAQSLRPQAGWNWRTGTRSGYLFSGQKYKGSNIYPSSFGSDSSALRDQSRAAYWDSTQARAIIGRMTDNVVGTGLALEARPVWSIIGDLGMSDDERHALARNIELRFDLWAMSRESDASSRKNFYEIQSHEYLNRLRDGETFCILRYSSDARRMNPVSIQFVCPEQVCTPYDKQYLAVANQSGNRIIEGIEIDAFGKELAIHVLDSQTNTFTRIPTSGPTRLFVVHPMIADELGAIRGTSILAPCIHELKKITDYTVAEIEAAVLNAILAVWVKPSPDAPASRALRNMMGSAPAANTSTTDDQEKTSFDKPGLIVQSLKAGESLESFDTKRPNANFGEFVRTITKHLSAAIGIPLEILEQLFSSNYSASRAALLLFWRKVEIERSTTASQFLSPVYEAWFAEEVGAGRINAPGFNGSSPAIRRAWLNHSWNGDSQPAIDPVKEAQADDLRIAQGSTTHERVAMEYNGSDYMENTKRLKAEKQAMTDAVGKPEQSEYVTPPSDEEETQQVKIKEAS